MSGDAIGRLRHRVVLQRAVRSDADAGGATIAWQSVGIAFAAIEATTGSEVTAGDGLAGRASYRVTLRYRTDIGPASRIVAGGRVFNILAALDIDGRKHWLQCLCEEELT